MAISSYSCQPLIFSSLSTSYNDYIFTSCIPKLFSLLHRADPAHATTSSGTPLWNIGLLSTSAFPMLFDPTKNPVPPRPLFVRSPQLTAYYAVYIYVLHHQFYGVASHNFIGVGEHYHQPLRRIFTLPRQLHPTLYPEVALQYAIKQLNGTVGPNGLCPTLLLSPVIQHPFLHPSIPT